MGKRDLPLCKEHIKMRELATEISVRQEGMDKQLKKVEQTTENIWAKLELTHTEVGKINTALAGMQGFQNGVHKERSQSKRSVTSWVSIVVAITSTIIAFVFGVAHLIG